MAGYNPVTPSNNSWLDKGIGMNRAFVEIVLFLLCCCFVEVIIVEILRP
jgi:hypothetical protein